MSKTLDTPAIPPSPGKLSPHFWNCLTEVNSKMLIKTRILTPFKNYGDLKFIVMEVQVMEIESSRLWGLNTC